MHREPGDAGREEDAHHWHDASESRGPLSNPAAHTTSGPCVRRIAPDFRFAWTHGERAAGLHTCFAVAVGGTDTAVGLFQVRQLEPGWAAAEWGFALGSSYWGTGVFIDGAQLVVDFAFGTIGVHRLEARAAAQNGRGNGALRKVGATQEGVLRKSFQRNSEYLDQVL